MAEISWRWAVTEKYIYIWGGVTGTCSWWSWSWCLLWLGEAGQESCSSDEEECSWSLSSIATGAKAHSVILNPKGARVWWGLSGNRTTGRLKKRMEKGQQRASQIHAWTTRRTWGVQVRWIKTRKKTTKKLKKLMNKRTYHLQQKWYDTCNNITRDWTIDICYKLICVCIHLIAKSKHI